MVRECQIRKYFQEYYKKDKLLWQKRYGGTRGQKSPSSASNGSSSNNSSSSNSIKKASTPQSTKFVDRPSAKEYYEYSLQYEYSSPSGQGDFYVENVYAKNDTLYIEADRDYSKTFNVGEDGNITNVERFRDINSRMRYETMADRIAYNVHNAIKKRSDFRYKYKRIKIVEES